MQEKNVISINNVKDLKIINDFSTWLKSKPENKVEIK